MLGETVSDDPVDLINGSFPVEGGVLSYGRCQASIPESPPLNNPTLAPGGQFTFLKIAPGNSFSRGKIGGQYFSHFLDYNNSSRSCEPGAQYCPAARGKQLLRARILKGEKGIYWMERTFGTP